MGFLRRIFKRKGDKGEDKPIVVRISAPAQEDKIKRLSKEIDKLLIDEFIVLHNRAEDAVSCYSWLFSSLSSPESPEDIRKKLQGKGKSDVDIERICAEVIRRKEMWITSRSRMREIGRSLHEKGGLDLMEAFIWQLNRRRCFGAAELASAVWSGIGGWIP